MAFIKLPEFLHVSLLTTLNVKTFSLFYCVQPKIFGRFLLFYCVQPKIFGNSSRLHMPIFEVFVLFTFKLLCAFHPKRMSSQTQLHLRLVYVHSCYRNKFIVSYNIHCTLYARH